ncbi:chromosome partitioning protein [Lewinella aquimaris]|uniref:Chromosome partitioning protein n=1 Tax=Neolewinella aquimaris TaxID=1835722 RepID=A0A840E3Q3_9BACT|nr:ParA family protein [Neolewinella aquimaris]MBB4079710.1 chromosome partitioning protein [Neolewinella aquimaris]
MPTISLAIQKGGSGKTTTALNLAAALRRLGRSVLLVDLDPQANLTHSLGIRDEERPNIYHLLHREMNGERADIRSIVTVTDSGQALVPAGLELADAELELVATYGREHIVKRLLQPLVEEYDYILIDCPPAVGMLTVNALVASDFVILPLQAEYLPVKGLESYYRHHRRLQRTLNPDLRVLGIVLSRYDGRKNLHLRSRTQLETAYPGWLFPTTIRTNIALAEAQEAGHDIFTHAPAANGAEDHLSLAYDVEKRIRTGVPEGVP